MRQHVHQYVHRNLKSSNLCEQNSQSGSRVNCLQNSYICNDYDGMEDESIHISPEYIHISNHWNQIRESLNHFIIYGFVKRI